MLQQQRACFAHAFCCWHSRRPFLFLPRKKCADYFTASPPLKEQPTVDVQESGGLDFRDGKPSCSSTSTTQLKENPFVSCPWNQMHVAATASIFSLFNIQHVFTILYYCLLYAMENALPFSGKMHPTERVFRLNIKNGLNKIWCLNGQEDKFWKHVCVSKVPFF